MEILYNYKPYEQAKDCLYNAEGDTFNFPQGWAQIETQATVIGETETCYVTRLLPTTLSQPPHTRVILPIGFHKARLIKRLPTQLSLF